MFNASWLHFSSGSSGAPTAWPRTIQSELEVALTFERVMRDAFEAHTQRTLCIVAFPLGLFLSFLCDAMYQNVCS